MEGAASGDVEEVAGYVRPVWAEAGKVILRGYLQRKNSLGSGTTATVFGGNPTISACRKKYKIKGGGRKAPTSGHNGPQRGPCQRLAGFPLSTGLGGRFQEFSKSRWSVEQKIQRSQAVSLCRAGDNIFPSESSNLASLYQRKGPKEIAAQGVLNKLITLRFCPGYSPQVRVLCVSE